MKFLLGFSLVLFSLAASHTVSAADEILVSSQHINTKIEYFNGSYTSIFELVPDSYQIEIKESRQARIVSQNDTAFDLHDIEARVQRILRKQDTVSTIEVDENPLNGKELHFVLENEKWMPTSAFKDGTPLTSEQLSAAERLVSKLGIKNSPFAQIEWGDSGEGLLKVQKFLDYLGYEKIIESHGICKVRKGKDADKSETPAAEVFQLEIDAAFELGEGLERRTTVLKASGSYRKIKGTDESQLVMEGKIVTDGERIIPPERKVPYTLEADFKYDKTTK